MESEPDSTPKLSLFSLPYKSPEPPGMLTPPLRNPASIPFQWEEAPGKPRACTNTTTTQSKPSTATAARCLALELPPRLLSEVKLTNISSPTTVLDGPYVGRSRSVSSYSSSSLVSRERYRSSFSSPDGDAETSGSLVYSSSKREHKERGWQFGSWMRKGSLRGNRETLVGGEGRFVFSSSSLVSGGDGEEEGNGSGVDNNTTKVKITRIRRNGSFCRVSNTRSHLWASLYETLKHVVPWSSSRKLKKDGLVM